MRNNFDVEECARWISAYLQYARFTGRDDAQAAQWVAGFTSWICDTDDEISQVIHRASALNRHIIKPN